MRSRSRRSAPHARDERLPPPSHAPAATKKTGRKRKRRSVTRPVDLPPLDLLGPDSGHYGSLDVGMLAGSRLRGRWKISACPCAWCMWKAGRR